MTALYNDSDPYACAWLEALIAEDHIPAGDVVCADVRTLEAADLARYDQVHLFAGTGAWALALRLAGWPDDHPVWTGSCPCQPFSSASRGRRRGTEDERHLWPVFHGYIRELRPDVVFGEQVAGVAGRTWFDHVASDFELDDYAVGAADLCASTLGFPRRRRLYFAAHTDREGQCPVALDAEVARLQTARDVLETERDVAGGVGEALGRSGTRVARLRAYGNAIVAPLGATFIQAYRRVC